MMIGIVTLTHSVPRLEIVLRRGIHRVVVPSMSPMRSKAFMGVSAAPNSWSRLVKSPGSKELPATLFRALWVIMPHRPQPVLWPVGPEPLFHGTGSTPEALINRPPRSHHHGLMRERCTHQEQGSHLVTRTRGS